MHDFCQREVRIQTLGQSTMPFRRQALNQHDYSSPTMIKFTLFPLESQQGHLPLQGF
jgi:hypothetical protein